MLKEIYEQPQSVDRCIWGRVLSDKGGFALSSVEKHKEKLKSASRFIIVGCGSSWHAGLYAKQLIERYAGVAVTIEYSSEFLYRRPVLFKDDVLIAISHSGETADTISAVELARSNGVFTYAICKGAGSTISKISDCSSYTHVESAIGAASTKAFTAQLSLLVIFALSLASIKGNISEEECEAIAEELSDIPEKMLETLSVNQSIFEITRAFTFVRNFLFLARGYNYPIALEGALKLKEISYIHAEGYPAAEMKHGPIAMIDGNMPCIVVATQNKMYEKIVSNIHEIKSRGGRVIAIVSKGDKFMQEIADHTIEVPQTIECLEPLLTIIPLQLLAYHLALHRGVVTDQACNLAKSVTVE